MIVDRATPKLNRGSVGQGSQSFKSTTRTSKLAFVDYDPGYMKNMLARFSDVLGIPLEKLRRRAEPLQVVQYLQRQMYAPHVDASTTEADTRFLTMLTVLREADSGGCTSFPRAFERKGLEVCMHAGDAVLFYSLLPDGNLDEDSVHAGDVVNAGIKWAANIWVHDSPRKDAIELSTVHALDL